MKLNLKRPIVFFDLETTGTNINKDRIVEISILKIHPNHKEELVTYRVNPGMPIPKEASAVHGIYDEDVKDAPTFKEIAKEIYDFIDGCDLAGFNSNRFDIPMLVEEFLRAGVNFDPSNRRMVDVQVIYHKMEQRTLSAAYKFYCGKDLENAHSAEDDTRATYEILEKQLEKYSEVLENDIEKLAEFSQQGKKKLDFAGHIVYDDNGTPVFNFGKYKGKPVTEVLEKDPGYFGWIMNADFPLYTKKVLEAIKLSMKFDNVKLNERKIDTGKKQNQNKDKGENKQNTLFG